MSLNGMQIDVIHYKPHTLSLRPFKLFFQQLHWFLQLWSCFIKWHEKEGSIKLWLLLIHNGGCFETLNLIHVISCKIFTFWDVLNETKQKNAMKISRVSAVRTENHLYALAMSLGDLWYMTKGRRKHQSPPKKYCLCVFY